MRKISWITTLGFFFALVTCSGKGPLIWGLQKSFKARGVISYGKWGTALLQNPLPWGVRISNQKNAPEVSQLLGRIFKTQMVSLNRAYELTLVTNSLSPSSSTATPTLLLTVKREGDHGKLSLKAMLENRELGRFEALIRQDLLVDPRDHQSSPEVLAKASQGLWGHFKSLFASNPEDSEVFAPINEFLFELGTPGSTPVEVTGL